MATLSKTRMRSRPRLRILQAACQSFQPARIHIAHGDHFKFVRLKSFHLESRMRRLKLMKRPRAIPLLHEYRNTMAADAEEKLCYRTIVQIRQVRAVESRARRQRLRNVEAEWQLPLEPRLHRVPVRRYHLWRPVGREHRDVQIACLRNHRRTFSACRVLSV